MRSKTRLLGRRNPIAWYLCPRGWSALEYASSFEIVQVPEPRASMKTPAHALPEWRFTSDNQVQHYKSKNFKGFRRFERRVACPLATLLLATQILPVQRLRVSNSGIESSGRMPDGEDEALLVTQVPRPHARRGRTRHQLQAHSAAERVSFS